MISFNPMWHFWLAYDLVEIDFLQGHGACDAARFVLLCNWAANLMDKLTNSPCFLMFHVSKSFNPECFAVTIGNVRHPLRQILDLRCRAFQRDHLKRLWMNCLGRYLVSKMQRVRACGILWQRRVQRCWHAVISNKAIVASGHGKIVGVVPACDVSLLGLSGPKLGRFPPHRYEKSIIVNMWNCHACCATGSNHLWPLQT